MKRRGFSLTELLVGLSAMAIVMTGAMALLVGGVRSMNRNAVDTNLAQSNAQGLRRMAETLREAMSVSISSDGRTLTYTLPQVSSSVDPNTGEREYVIPLASDGVTRTFRVADGVLRDGAAGNRVLVRNISNTDLLASSSQYGQTYPVFQMMSVGSTKAVSINLITTYMTPSGRRYQRMKTTAMLRNLP